MESQAWISLQQRISAESSADLRPVHPMVIEPGYILPRTDSPNWPIAASILETWINEANEASPGSMSPRSAEWLTGQAHEGNLVMIIGLPQGKSHQTLFGGDSVDESVLEERIVAIACVSSVDGFSRDELLDMGTVITNPRYRSNSEYKGIDGGAYAFLAAMHHAKNQHPTARLNTWTKNGSTVALFRATGVELPVVSTSDEEVTRGIVDICRRTCPNFDVVNQACCHRRSDVTYTSTSGMFVAED